MSNTNIMKIISMYARVMEPQGRYPIPLRVYMDLRPRKDLFLVSQARYCYNIVVL